jgi:hypothetical protein
MPDGSLVTYGTRGMAQGAQGIEARIGRQAPIHRLPDQLEIKFGPIEQLGRFVLRADRKLRDHGIRLTLSSDFEELRELNAQHRKNDWFALPPMFDPVFAKIGPDNAFWLKGIDHAGETVLAHAMRLYVWRDSTLKEEAESLRMLYDVAIDTPGARGEVSAPIASLMTGRVGYMGALWLRSEFRGKKLASTISPLTRAIGLARWYPSMICSLVSTASVDNGRAALYGWPSENVEQSVKFFNLPGGHDKAFDFSVCFMSSEEIEAVVAETVAEQQRTAAMPGSIGYAEASETSGSVL